MNHYGKSPWAFRAAARVLIPLQVLVYMPLSAPVAAAQEAPGPESEPEPVLTPTNVVVNRTVPSVPGPPGSAPFSARPTKEEIFRAQVFPEPLVPMAGTTEDDDKALVEAIKLFRSTGEGGNLGALQGFADANPASPWRGSLLMNLGTFYRARGYYSKALDAWQRAWDLTKGSSGPEAAAVADGALGEMCYLRTRLGHAEILKELLEEVGARDVRGSATEKVNRAREGLWQLENQMDFAKPSIATALDRIMAIGDEEHKKDQRLIDFHPTRMGVSLTEGKALADSVELDLQMAFREGTVEIPIGSVVHLKVEHFAAVVDKAGDKYLLDDPFLGGRFWIGSAALNHEASGYFLIPGGPLPKGWRAVDVEEGKGPQGHCGEEAGDPDKIKSCNKQGGTGGCSQGACKGMAGYSVHLLTVNLRISDSPVGHTPPRGPAIELLPTYNHRETNQPQTFSYSNLGPKWTFDWLSYVTDDPVNLSADVSVYLRGAGRERLSGFDVATQSYEFEPDSHSQLVRTQASPIRYERRLPDGSVEVFSQPDGGVGFPRKIFLTSWSDPQGNSVSLTYDASFRIIALTDAIGQVSTVSYQHPSDSLKITKVTDPFGRFASFEYNTQGQLRKITDVIGINSEFIYDTGDFIKALTTPYGTTTFEVSTPISGDRRIDVTDPLGGRERFMYRASTSAIPPSEPANVVPQGMDTLNLNLDTYNSFYWDKRAMALYPDDFTKARVIHWLWEPYVDELFSDTIASEKMPLENRVWYAYPATTSPYIANAHRQPSAVGRALDDATSQVYRYEYNSLGKVTRATDPLGRTKTYAYNTNNIDLKEVRRVNGQNSELLQSFTYNSQHQPLTVTDVAGQTTTYTYDAQGRVTTVVTPPRDGLSLAQRTTTNMYDANGVLQSVTGPVAGATTSYTYDGYGRVRTVTDVDGYVLTYDYDALDRTTKVTYPDSTFEQIAYNRLDAEQRRDRLGRWSRTFFDALRRPTAMRDPAGRTVSQEWCNCGSMDMLIDPKGNATTWERDLQSRVTKEIRANGSFKEFTYETTTSRLKRVRDAKNQEINYSYFLDDQLQQTSYTNAQVATPTMSFTYDPVEGRLATMSDGTGTSTYAYHPVTVPPSLGADQLASVDGPLTNDAIAYAYDELGRVVSRTLNGVTSTWAYDALGRLTTLGDPIGNFTYGYAGSTGRVSTVNYPNGQTTSYAYLPVNQDLRLQEIHHKKPGGVTLNKFNYTYDVVGNILTWAQQTDTNPAQTYSYEYDRADQLSAATLAAATPKRYRYAYDPAGNRTAEQIDDAATLSTHDNMNRLLTQVPGGAMLFRGTTNEPAKVTVQSAPATTTSTNQFSGTAPVSSPQTDVVVQATDYASPTPNVRTNTYRVTQSGPTKNFTYDPNGNLTSDGTKTYEWDAENRLLAVKQGAATLASFTYDGSGRRATKTAGGTTTTYVYAGAQFLEERPSGGSTKRYVYGTGIDRPLAQVIGGATTYNVADHLGSVLRTTDTTGTPTLTREYDPWGNPLQGSATSGYAYTGREWDSEAGLYYYRARYYDPNVGRFLSEDPIGLKGGGPNYYSYVGNNPIRRADPLGLAPLVCVAWPMDSMRSITAYGFLANSCEMLAICMNCDGTYQFHRVTVWIPFYKSRCPKVCGPMLLWSNEATTQGGRLPTPLMPIVFCEW